MLSFMTNYVISFYTPRTTAGKDYVHRVHDLRDSLHSIHQNLFRENKYRH